MSEEVLDSSANAGTGERPVFLTVVCILSFVGVGFAIIGYTLLIAAMGVVQTGVDAAVANGATATGGTGAGWLYIIVGFVMAIVALMGVIKMWKLQKAGFMLYVASQVVMIVMTIVFIGFSIGSLIFPVAFIAMYYANLKAMK